MYEPSWTSSTGLGWNSFSRSSPFSRVQRQRRSWPHWSKSLRKPRMNWPNQRPKGKNWRKKWWLSWKRKMTYSSRFNLWVPLCWMHHVTDFNCTIFLTSQTLWIYKWPFLEKEYFQLLFSVFHLTFNIPMKKAPTTSKLQMGNWRIYLTMSQI